IAPALMACIVCGGVSAVATRLRRDLVRCANCGLLYAPHAVEDGAEFGERYYRDGAYADYEADRSAIARSGADRLETLERMVRGRRLLDVGCASGYFLDAARRRGWDVVGLEISQYTASAGRRLGIEIHEAS